MNIIFFCQTKTYANSRMVSFYCTIAVLGVIYLCFLSAISNSWGLSSLILKSYCPCYFPSQRRPYLCLISWSVFEFLSFMSCPWCSLSLMSYTVHASLSLMPSPVYAIRPFPSCPILSLMPSLSLMPCPAPLMLYSVLGKLFLISYGTVPLLSPPP